MQAQALDGLRDEALRLDTEPVRVHAGRRIQTYLHGKGRQFQRLLVEVIERAQSEIAGLRPVVDLAGVDGDSGTDADLKVRKRSIQQFNGEEPTVGAAPLERESRT